MTIHEAIMRDETNVLQSLRCFVSDVSGLLDLHSLWRLVQQSYITLSEAVDILQKLIEQAPSLVDPSHALVNLVQYCGMDIELAKSMICKVECGDPAFSMFLLTQKSSCSNKWPIASREWAENAIEKCRYGDVAYAASQMHMWNKSPLSWAHRVILGSESSTFDQKCFATQCLSEQDDKFIRCLNGCIGDLVESLSLGLKRDFPPSYRVQLRCAGRHQVKCLYTPVDAIAKTAFEIYQTRIVGGTEGSPESDWLIAEHNLTATLVLHTVVIKGGKVEYIFEQPACKTNLDRQIYDLANAILRS